MKSSAPSKPRPLERAGIEMLPLKRLLALLVFFAVICSFIPITLAYSEDEAKAAIAEAEIEVLNCYGVAFKAEKAGANVSDLLNALNEAGWLLSRAKLAYSQSDFDSAVAFAAESRAKLADFVFRADDLRRKAEEATRRDFMFNFLGSAAGASCIVVGGFALWSLLKRREKSHGEV